MSKDGALDLVASIFHRAGERLAEDDGSALPASTAHEPDGTWTVACDVCRCWHHHNPDNPEPARCVGGPYGTTGYWMQYGGRRVRVRSWRSLNPGRLRIWHGEDIFNPPGTSPFDPEVAAA